MSAALRFASLAALLVAPAACSRLDPGSETGSITAGGRERTFVFHVPASAPAEGTRTLIVSLHGRGGTGVQQEDLTGFSALSDERGFIAVYPDGVDKSWADGRGTSDAETQGVDDVAFVGALIDRFVAEFGADPARVFVTGHSNGSIMTNRLGCELAGKIAAIGTVAGPIAEDVSTACAPARGLSVIAFHGTDDGFVPYTGGEVDKGAGGVVLGAKGSRDWWAGHAGCSGAPTLTTLPDVAPDDGTTVEREDSVGCQDGLEVVLHTIVGGGHTWPGSDHDLGEALVGKSSRDVVASELMVEFFARHGRP